METEPAHVDPRPVKLGFEQNGYAQVPEGLQSGQGVVAQEPREARLHGEPTTRISAAPFPS